MEFFVSNKMKPTSTKKKTLWQQFIKYQMAKTPEKNLKEILKNYSKKEYAAFKKDPAQFLE